MSLPRAYTFALLSIALNSCLGSPASVCHQIAVQRLSCCPLCDEDCAQDPKVLREEEACVEALDQLKSDETRDVAFSEEHDEEDDTPGFPQPDDGDPTDW